MIKSDRLKARIAARKTTQADLARAIGVSPQAISKMVTGDTTDTSKLYQIASFLHTTPEYLAGESDEADPSAVADRRLPFRGAEPELPSDLVQIDQINMAYGLGGTFIDNDALEVEKVTFSRAWLRSYTHSFPELLFTTDGVGDSMEPTISDHDVIIGDRGQVRLDQVKGDKIWACVFAGVGMVKRLRALPDGTVRIMSDNHVVRDELATDGDLHIVGRIVAVVKRH